MEQKNIRYRIAVLSFVVVSAFLIACTSSLPEGLTNDNFHTSMNWIGENSQHDDVFLENPVNMQGMSWC